MTIYADAAQHISHSTLVIDNNNNNNVDVDQVVEIGENKAHFCLPLALSILFFTQLNYMYALDVRVCHFHASCHWKFQRKFTF